MEENLLEKKHTSKQVYDGELLKVFKDEVILPNGKQASREYIKHIGAVGIVPLTDDNKVYVERQFRYPFNSVFTEIPAGKLDRKDEDHLIAAKRELKEETGLVANKWTFLGVFAPAVAYSDEAIWLYLAQDLHIESRNLDDDEFLDVTLVSLDELVEQILSGEITDGKTICALLKVAMLKNREV